MVNCKNRTKKKIFFFILLLDAIQRSDFKFHDGTYIDEFTCPLNVNGTIILFGGNPGGFDTRRQVSVVYPFGVKLINTLSFDFGGGKCHLYNGHVFLCFDINGPKLCRNRKLSRICMMSIDQESICPVLK